MRQGEETRRGDKARTSTGKDEGKARTRTWRGRGRVCNDPTRRAIRVSILGALEEEAGEGREAGRHTHHDAAGEVLHAALGEHAAAPDPMAPRRVDDGQSHRDEEEDVCLEAKAVCEASRHQRGRHDGEHALVGHEQQPGICATTTLPSIDNPLDTSTFCMPPKRAGLPKNSSVSP